MANDYMTFAKQYREDNPGKSMKDAAAAFKKSKSAGKVPVAKSKDAKVFMKKGKKGKASSKDSAMSSEKKGMATMEATPSGPTNAFDSLSGVIEKKKIGKGFPTF